MKICASMRGSMLMEDRADGEIAFEVLERFLHRHELQIVGPQLGRIVLGEIGAQADSGLRAAAPAQLVAIELIGEVGAVRRDHDLDQAPCGGCPGARGAELHQQLFARDAHARELAQPRP